MKNSFEPTGLGLTIFNERYAQPEEDWKDACSRVADAISSAEPSEKRKLWYNKFNEQLLDGKFMPGGRIMHGAGHKRQSMLNCFVVPTHDTIEGWAETEGNTMIISSRGGGVGTNYSPLRGRGYPIGGMGGTSTGAVSLMQVVDSTGEVIKDGAGRRTALMMCLDINHPDIEEFLNAKLDKGELENANISVVIPQDLSTEEFVELVRSDGELPLRFGGLPDKLGRTLKAKKLWGQIVYNAWLNGEPGILNGHYANKMNNMFYHWPLISTNPCVTGDTVISTVDGPRTFKELADDGRDVQVYSWHPETKKPVIRMMRRPHKTQFNVPILEVEFDSGLKLRCTPDHHLYDFRGKKVKAKDLKVGKSVRAFSMSEHRDGHLRVHAWDSSADKACHQWVHRMVYENHFGPIPEGLICHHKNDNPQDNHISNLELLTKEEHNIEHYLNRKANGFDGSCKNHKVVSIKEAGREDVYNGCVDDSHTYIILDPEPIAGIQSGIISANCGEIWLPAYGCCDLGALVLPRFVGDGEVDWDALDESVRVGIRFLDDVLDVNHYPIPQIEKVCKEERRIGLGVMGLHSMLLDLGFKYNSSEAFEFVGRLFEFIKNTAYDASVTLAAEKGAFPAYHPDLLKSGFAKTLKRGIRNKIKMHGIRNCAILTIAPTGTTSMVQGVTGGIEPVFSPVYIRRRRVVDENQRESIVETLVISQEYVDHPELVQGAYDIHPRDHIEMQKVVQRHIDNAVSKTINLKRKFPVDELCDLWLDNLEYMKGSTFYREGSRESEDSFEPMKHIPIENMEAVIAEWTGEIEYEIPDVMDCASGVCEIK